jgi:hypothetical protein
MKITTFNPFIEAQSADELIKLFGEMGFERHHTKQGIEIADREDTVFRMKDAGGFYLDILQSKTGVSGDTVGIRMNVDDFDAACELLRQHGFTNAFGDDTVATKSSKAAMMVSPSGFRISVIQHIKDHD